MAEAGFLDFYPQPALVFKETGELCGLNSKAAALYPGAPPRPARAGPESWGARRAPVGQGRQPTRSSPAADAADAVKSGSLNLQSITAGAERFDKGSSFDLLSVLKQHTTCR
jgi:hypothetical protein